MKVLGTQLAGVAKRPARLLLTGLAVLVASFVVYATVLAQQITERTAIEGLSGTPAAVDLVIGAPADSGGGVQIRAADVAALRALPGVAEAVGRAEGGGDLNGDYLAVMSDPGSGPLATVKIAKGVYPSKPGEIAVTPRTADRMGLPVGSAVTIHTDWDDKGRPIKPAQVKVTGIVDADSDYGFVGYAPEKIVTALSRDKYMSRVELRLAPGTDRAAVTTAAERIIAAAPAPAEGADRAAVMQGDDVRLAEANEAASDLDEVFIAVGVFVFVAVLAAGLVATSTFRIVFAQRMRQLALLRAVGAGRGSIWRALAVEGALTGFVAGTVGVLGALLVGYAVLPLAGLFDLDLVAPGLPLMPALGVVALAVGITVLAVLAPAFTAAKVAPLEALRSASTTGGRKSIGVLRGVLGVLLLGGAGVLAAYVFTNLPGRDTRNYNPEPMLLATVGSGALAFLALMALGPLLVRPVLATVGWPLRRLGPVGRLAVGGVGGAPRRAAAVSIVVALGVTLIAGVVVTGASVRVLAGREMAVSSPADYELTANGDEKISQAVLDQIRQSPDLAHVSPYRRLSGVRVGATDDEAAPTDLVMSGLPELRKVDATEGSLAALGPGKIVLAGYAAENHGLHVGDTTTLTKGKKQVKLEVVAVLPDDGPLHAYFMLDPSDLTKLGATATYSGVLADAAKDGEQGRTAGQKALRQAVQGRPGYGVEVLADQRDEFNLVLNGVLAVVIGLVGLTVLIAVVGVGTTTALSVVERVRESGLLRAVGLSRGGLRAMLTAESSLYGLIGATIGLVLGVPYAWLSLKALGVNAPLELPAGQLLVVFLALIVFTAAAGVLPARRAAKVSPVAALATD
ncbi:ABC transporter [Actinoplanes sp. NBRC 14428]|uniref:Putative ABC transport system permease protein n=1 Tax=Pseudosporangium ferrugineum TaxID=439699 RepID=A0A2T0SJE1_9ACTN|nr:ABC transporter permease [Pseudosporangium ferrugineum]PRY33521.1 putative ABC transport system permease protein [Pseudosporangium ferrugineum]BCJ56532.1 ABC transporter [Actinoplanes sp. NBRC 14428]